MNNMDEKWDDENDYDDDEDFSLTDEEFDSLDDILCETCGEPCEHRLLMEDADFGTVLQVCADCLRELTEEEPDRWVAVDEQ